jgi:hypothetical protein
MEINDHEGKVAILWDAFKKEWVKMIIEQHYSTLHELYEENIDQDIFKKI